MTETTAAAPRRHRFEMALTFADARRLAVHLADDGRLAIADRRLAGTCDGRPWSLALGPERRRTIALLDLAICDVELDLAGFEAAAEAAFLDRFHRVFQRGGG